MRVRALPVVLGLLAVRPEPAPRGRPEAFLANAPATPSSPWSRRGTFAWDDQEGGFLLVSAPGGPWRLDLLDGGGRPLARIRADAEALDVWVPATRLVVRAPTGQAPWLAALPGWIEQGGVGLGDLQEATWGRGGWSELRRWPGGPAEAQLALERGVEGDLRWLWLDAPWAPRVEVVRAGRTAVVQVGSFAPAVLRWSGAAPAEAVAARPPLPPEAVELTVGELWSATIGRWLARRALAIDRRLEALTVSGEGGFEEGRWPR